MNKTNPGTEENTDKVQAFAAFEKDFLSDLK